MPTKVGSSKTDKQDLESENESSDSLIKVSINHEVIML